MKIELQALRAKIRGFEAEATSIRKRINKSSGAKRCALWQRKRELGVYTREHLIAYGLIRGITYEKLESKSVQKINIDNVLEVIHSHVYRWDRAKWTKERLEALLVRPPLSPEAPEKSLVPQQVGVLARVAGLFR